VLPAHLVFLCTSEYFAAQVRSRMCMLTFFMRRNVLMAACAGQVEWQQQQQQQQEQQQQQYGNRPDVEEDQQQPEEQPLQQVSPEDQQSQEQQPQPKQGQQHQPQQAQSGPAGQGSRPQQAGQPRPQLVLHLDQPDHETAAVAVLAVMYGVQDALSELTQVQLVQAVVYADRLAVTAAERAAIKLLMQAAEAETGLTAEVLQELGCMSAWPQCLLPLLPLVAKQAQYPLPSVDSSSSSSSSTCHLIQQVLLLVLGDLWHVWHDVQLSSMLLALPLAALQLLLSSDQLRTDSEDTVLYTAQKYLSVQPQQDQEAVMQGLAPLIRCPLLCDLQLAAHNSSSCRTWWPTQPGGRVTRSSLPVSRPRCCHQCVTWCSCAACSK